MRSPRDFSTPVLRHRRSIAPVLLLVIVLLSACGGSPSGTRSLTITPSVPAIAVGESVTLSASLAGVPTADVSWSSSVAGVAGVSDAGVVTGMSAGVAQVTARLDGEPAVTGTVSVTVGGSGASPAALADLDGGLTHTVALDVNGDVWSWGANLLGQLGTGSLLPSQSQAPLKAGITDVVAIAAGDHFSLAVRSDGSVWSWGSNSSGQLGTSAADSWEATPVQVAGVENAVAVTAAASTAVALLADGTLVAWGANTSGALGRGAFIPVQDATPVAVAGVSGVEAVALGGSLSQVHGLALLEDGTLVTWGSNALAALGQPTSTPANPTPAAVAGVTNVAAIAAGQNVSLAVTEAGEVYGWGSANVGQLGAGTVGAFSQAPIKADVADVVAVAAGHQHTVALHDDGTLSSWGSNTFGQLGIGVGSGFRLSPQVVSGSGYTVVAAGVQFSLALDGDGSPWAWGNNLNLQLGLAAESDTTSPGAVW